jgi:hypothetical protein
MSASLSTRRGKQERRRLGYGSSPTRNLPGSLEKAHGDEEVFDHRCLHDCSGNWDNLNLIFPVYLKLMTGFRPFSQKRKIISNKGQQSIAAVGWDE